MPKSGVLLGKITEPDGFVSASKHTLRQTPIALPQVDSKTFDLYVLFENLLKEEIHSHKEVFGRERAGALLTSALMWWSLVGSSQTGLSLSGT
jgi:hypothetical protein